jgi:hypothetical protein
MSWNRGKAYKKSIDKLDPIIVIGQDGKAGVSSECNHWFFIRRPSPISHTLNKKFAERYHYANESPNTWMKPYGFTPCGRQWCFCDGKFSFVGTLNRIKSYNHLFFERLNNHIIRVR